MMQRYKIFPKYANNWEDIILKEKGISDNIFKDYTYPCNKRP